MKIMPGCLGLGHYSSTSFIFYHHNIKNWYNMTHSVDEYGHHFEFDAPYSYDFSTWDILE